MVDYTKTKRGDILRVTTDVLGTYAKKGDLVRVVQVQVNRVTVENYDGVQMPIAFNVGAQHLEPTEWTNDFDLAKGAV